MKPDTAGALFMVLAMVGFGIEDALFKAATSSVSAGAGTVVFGLTALTLSALGARHAGVEIWPRAAFRGWLLVRNIFEVCGRLFFALALAYTPLSTTSAILQAAPLVVTLGAALVLGERVGPRRWAAMAVGFAGVLMILRPGLDSFRPDAVFALLGMVGFAGRDLATRASPPHVHAAQLGVLGFAAVAVAGLVILALEPARQAPDGRALILLLITGCVGVLAYTALTRAMRTGDDADGQYADAVPGEIVAVRDVTDAPASMKSAVKAKKVLDDLNKGFAKSMQRYLTGDDKVGGKP